MKSKILVTGMHRAGTHFIARCLAYNYGYNYYEERVIKYTKTELIDTLQEPFVLQAPFLASICHQFKDWLVVWVDRDDKEIINSLNNMRDEEGYPIYEMDIELGERKRYNATQTPKTILEIKRECWLEQRERLPDHLELHYEAFKKHPLYVKERGDWIYNEPGTKFKEKKEHGTVIRVKHSELVSR